jgi:hypothetical protein
MPFVSVWFALQQVPYIVWVYILLVVGLPIEIWLLNKYDKQLW